MSLTDIVVFDGVEEQTDSLPESKVLTLLAMEGGIDEASAAKLNAFLADQKNTMLFIVASPVPDDKQIERNDRTGKNTLKTDEKGVTTGVDNSKKIVSKTNVYARIDTKLPLGERETGSRYQFRGQVFARTVLDPEALANETE